MADSTEDVPTVNGVGEGDERGAGPGQLKKHDHKEAVHLDKVTDYVEEQEISGDVGKAVSEMIVKDKSAKELKEKELAKVVIKKEDVELIMRELEISKSKAERSLREHKGDIVQALHVLTD